MQTVIIDWNGNEIPEGLRELPPGRYVVETLEAPDLTPEEDAGLRRALNELDAGHTLPFEQVMSRAKALLDGE